MIWAALAFVLVAVTKYATSVRLRRLRDRLQQDQTAADELHQLLMQAAEKESVLQAQAEALVQKSTTLQAIIANLERNLHRPGESPPAPGAG
jgi:peptidoglycan hydrolase CwlO-like protein